MQFRMIFASGIAAFALAACGGSDDYEVKEHIVVEEGDEASQAESDREGRESTLAAGKAAFAVCAACHSVGRGKPSQVGPNLFGVFGREAGTLDDFAYSDAMKASGITWDEASLDTYLTNPAANVEGTSMVAGAVRNADKRAALIAYLKSLSE